MIRLLSVLASAGMIGSSMIGTTSKNQSTGEYTQFTNPFATVDKTQLKSKIAEAQELLKNNNKSEWANTNLDTAIKRAEATLNDEKAIQSKVDEMVERLEAAITLFKNSPEVTNKEKLLAKINEATELLFTVHRSDRATGLLRAAISRAEVVLINPRATPETIELAIKTLDYEMAIYRSSTYIS